MGADCPNGHGRQYIIGNITADFGIPQKASDVVAHKLSCGCLIGGDELKAYQQVVNDIKRQETIAIMKVQNEAQTRLKAAIKTFITNRGK